MLNVDFGSDEEMEKAIVSTMDDMPRIQITTDNVKEEKDFGWSKNAVDERQKVRNLLYLTKSY